MVGARVKAIGAAYAPYAQIMVDNSIDGEMFVSLDEQELIEDLGVTRLHTRKLMALIHRLAATTTATEAGDSDDEEGGGGVAVAGEAGDEEDLRGGGRQAFATAARIGADADLMAMLSPGGLSSR
jgi:hypothetical protein